MGRGSDFKQTPISFWGDGNVLKLDCGEGDTTLVNTKNQQQFKKKKSTEVAASSQRSPAYIQRGTRKLFRMIKLLYLDCGGSYMTL